MHRRRGAIIASTIAVGALTVTAFTTASGAPTPGGQNGTADPTAPTVQTSPELLEAMERDLGLTPEEAEIRVANEYRAGAEAPRLAAELGAAYAGSWTTGPTSDLVVATTNPATTDLIERSGARAEVVETPLAELEAVKDRLDAASDDHATTEAPVWYVDVTENEVVLHAQETSAGQEFVTAAGLDAADVRVVRSDETPETFNDLVGGDPYHMGGGRCSVGFSVTQGGSEGFATAGHCGSVGTPTTGANGQAQGTFQGSVFPGSDMAWVQVNANWNVTPTVRGNAEAVAGSQQSTVGSSICRSGSTTGYHCGTIQQHNTSVTYPEGTITGVTRTSVCAEPGDSGGAYISGSQAQGVTSGGSGNCVTGGTTYHQPINPLLSQWQLDLVTTGTPGEPDPTDPTDPTDPAPGTWQAGSSYAVGDTVTHDGVEYRCVQAHTAHEGWTPPTTPSLWEAR